MTGPLDGLQVLDLTTAFSGPYCTLLLAEQGADVIKVEAPRGDIVRDVGTRRNPGMASTFLMANRGKRSIVLDLKHPAAQDVLTRMAESSDVFVHNMRSGAASRIGVDENRLRALNPNLIYCSISGYGPDGPYADRPAFDDTIQAASGLAALQGADGPPRYVTTVAVDKTAGITAAYGVMAALWHRERTGEARSVQVPMFEMMTSYVLAEQMGGRAYQPPIGPAVYPRTVSPHRRPYATRDGYISAMLYTDTHWRRFFDALDRDTMQDPRFATIGERTEHIDELYELVSDAMQERTSAEWIELLTGIDVPVAPVNDLESIFDDPHLRSTGFFRTEHHPTEGDLLAMPPLARIGPDEAELKPAPNLGQHTDAILAELGFTEDDIGQLERNGVVHQFVASSDK